MQVDVLVCGTLSGNSMAIMPIATENEIPLISMASARAIIEDPETGETRKWIFKTPQENLHSGEWQALYLEAQGITQICDLYENTGYGQDCLAQTTVAVEAKGIEVTYTDTFERSDTEFPQMAGVQGSGCEAVVVGAIPPGASMVTVALRETMPNVPVIQGHGVCNQTFIDLAGDAAEGVVFPCGRLMIADLLPDSDPQKAVLLKYAADYTAFTDGEAIDTFGGHAWDAMMWAIEGLESLNDGLSPAERRAGVRDYIENNIKNWPGTGGVFNISADDHLGLTYDDLTFVKVTNGTWAYFPTGRLVAFPLTRQSYDLVGSTETWQGHTAVARTATSCAENPRSLCRSVGEEDAGKHTRPASDSYRKARDHRGHCSGRVGAGDLCWGAPRT